MPEGPKLCSVVTIMCLYDTIITFLWHYYNHYDRVSAPNLSECADSSLLPEHGELEMIINRPWSLELDFNQQVGAQLSWEAARVSCPVLLYTLFVPLYSLWQMSDQDCGCSKKVLRTAADMQVTIWGVTSSWGCSKQAVDDARRAETVHCCYYCLSLWNYYFTYYIHYRHYYKIRICDSAWHSLKKRGQRHSPSHRISVSSKQKHNRLSLGAPRCPAPRAGRQQGRRCPSRPDGCRKASRRAWQDETDRPSHQRFWQ